MNVLFDFSKISDKQRLFLSAKQKYVAYGGARGGGKSWAIRAKSKLLCCNHPGIKCLIVRRSYPELINNHINQLKAETAGLGRYNSQEKVINFINGSSIKFMYCSNDADLERLQGTEFDVIFIDEACQLSEYQIKAIWACMR
jgi:phage terminase large subunit